MVFGSGVCLTRPFFLSLYKISHLPKLSAGLNSFSRDGARCNGGRAVNPKENLCTGDYHE